MYILWDAEKNRIKIKVSIRRSTNELTSKLEKEIAQTGEQNFTQDLEDMGGAKWAY